MDSPQPNKLHELILSGRYYNVPKGQILQSSDGRRVINFVKKGYIKRYLITNDGALSIQSLYGPGDAFPLTLMLKVLFNQDVYEGPEIIHYQAMTDTEVYSIDPDVLLREVGLDPLLYRDILKEAGVRLHSNIQHLENMGLKNSYKRTAHQLAYYARKFGNKKKVGTEICVPLTHQDLADILSLTRETVSASIGRLQSKKLIGGSKNIIVYDLAKLEEEAYG